MVDLVLRLSVKSKRDVLLNMSVVAGSVLLLLRASRAGADAQWLNRKLAGYAAGLAIVSSI